MKWSGVWLSGVTCSGVKWSSGVKWGKSGVEWNEMEWSGVTVKLG